MASLRLGRPPPPPPTVIKEGYMLKAPTGLLARVRSWERRFCQFYLVGSTPYLEFYKTEQDARSGYARGGSKRSTQRVQLNTVTKVITKIIDAKQPNEFTLIMCDRQVDLAAETRADKQSWCFSLTKTLSELGCLKGFEDNVYEEQKPISRLEQVARREQEERGAVGGRPQSDIPPALPPLRRRSTAPNIPHRPGPPQPRVMGSLRPVSADGEIAIVTPGTCPTATFDEEDEMPGVAPPPIPSRAYSSSCKRPANPPTLANTPRRQTHSDRTQSKRPATLNYPQVEVSVDMGPPKMPAPLPPPSVNYTEVQPFQRPPPLPTLPPRDEVDNRVGGGTTLWAKPQIDREDSSDGTISSDPIHDSISASLKRRLIWQRQTNEVCLIEDDLRQQETSEEDESLHHLRSRGPQTEQNLYEVDAANGPEDVSCEAEQGMTRLPTAIAPNGLFIQNAHFRMDSADEWEDRTGEEVPPALPAKIRSPCISPSPQTYGENDEETGSPPELPRKNRSLLDELVQYEKPPQCRAPTGPPPLSTSMDENIKSCEDGTPGEHHNTDAIGGIELCSSQKALSADKPTGGLEREDSGCPHSLGELSADGDTSPLVSSPPAFHKEPLMEESEEGDVSIVEAPVPTERKKPAVLESHDSQDSGIESPFNSNKMPNSNSNEALEAVDERVLSSSDYAPLGVSAVPLVSCGDDIVQNDLPPRCVGVQPSIKKQKSEETRSSHGSSGGSGDRRRTNSTHGEAPVACAAQVQMRRRKGGEGASSNRNSNRSSLVITCANGVQISATSDCEGDDEDDEGVSSFVYANFPPKSSPATQRAQSKTSKAAFDQRASSVDYANCAPRQRGVGERVDYANVAPAALALNGHGAEGFTAKESWTPVPIPRQAVPLSPSEEYMPVTIVEARERERSLRHGQSPASGSGRMARSGRSKSDKHPLPTSASAHQLRSMYAPEDRSRAGALSGEGVYRKLADMGMSERPRGKGGAVGPRGSSPCPPQEIPDLPHYSSPEVSLKRASSFVHQSVTRVRDEGGYSIASRGPAGDATSVSVRQPSATGSRGSPSSHRSTVSGGSYSTTSSISGAGAASIAPGTSPDIQSSPVSVQRRPKKTSRRELRSKHVSTPAAFDTLDARSSPYKPLHGGTLHMDGGCRFPAKRSSFPVSIPLRQMQTEELRQQMSHRSGVQISMWKQEALANVAFVDVMGCAWIAGWRQADSPLLQSFLHVGDQVVSLNGEPIATASKLIKRIKKAGSGAKLSFVLRRTPHARVFNITRDTPETPLGITCSDSAEILKVQCGGLINKEGLQPKTITMSGNALCNWIFTEINHKPLSLLCDGDEVRKRLGAVGHDISIMVQPKDFVDALKKQLIKSTKCYRQYLMP